MKNLYHIVILISMFSASVASGAETAYRDSVRTLESVVVTGVDGHMPQRLLPYTVSVVENRQLESVGQTQLLSAVSGMVPSLFVTQRGIFGFGVSNGGSGYIKLRGVGSERASATLMLLDGQPQFAGIYSHSIGDIYGKEYVDRVEVLRGPGSVLYGSNAMAGAINVITKSTKSDGVHTTVKSQYGSFNTWLSSISNTIRHGKFSSLVSLNYNRTDGNIKGMRFYQADGYGKIGYDFSNYWKGSIDYSLMNFRGHDPIYPKLSDPDSNVEYYQNITRGETSAYVSNNYGSTTGTARVYYSYGNHYIDDPRHFHSTDDRFGIMVYQNFKIWRGAIANVGFDFDTYSGRIPISGGTNHTEGSKSTIDTKRVTEYAPYVTLSQMLAHEIVNLNAGVRMANSDKFGTHWVPQFGFSVNPGDEWTVKGNLAMGYRNPSFRELYLYRMANPDLSPERMMNYELSVGKGFGRFFSAELTAYYSKGSNMIQVLDNKNQNTGKFINKGIELSMKSHPVDNVWLNATYSYLCTSLRNLTGAPRSQYFIGAEWRPKPFIDIAVDIKGVTGLYVAEDYEHQNYALLNLKASWDICKYVSVFISLENITDARYTINRGYEMPGFTAMGGFKLTF